MPEPNEPPELADALREHFARDLGQARFEPITGAEIRRAAAEPGRRRVSVVWLAVAAALAVLVPSGVVAASLFNRTIPAVPSPTEPITASPGPTASPTARPDAGWFPRVTAPVAVDGYAQTTLDGAVYLIAALPSDGACRLQGYRYQPAVDSWSPLPEGPSYAADDCTAPRVFARGAGLDVVVTGDRPRLHRYFADSSTWKTRAEPGDAAGCEPVGLAVGVFCLTDPARLTYQFYDPAAARWQEGELYLGTGEPSGAVFVRRVEVSGRESVLVVAERGGGVVAGSWDPASGSVVRVNPHPGLGHPVTDVQITADGFAVLTSDAPNADTALILELASGSWRAVEAPLAGGRLFREQPSDAAWVRLVYPEADDLAALNGYLYRPVDGSWSAAAPLPSTEPGAEPHDWVGAGGVCRRSAPFNCWGLSVGSLASVLTPVDPAAIAASNDELR